MVLIIVLQPPTHPCYEGVSAKIWRAKENPAEAGVNMTNKEAAMELIRAFFEVLPLTLCGAILYYGVLWFISL